MAQESRYPLPTLRESLWIRGSISAPNAERILDLRITPSASWSEGNAAHTIEWGVVEDGNYRVGKTLDVTIEGDGDNLLGVLRDALNSLDEKVFKTSVWLEDNTKEIEASE